MSDYDASTYGDRIAEVYDTWYADLDTDGAVDFLAGLAGPGPVLELAVGTGRIALPLLERGVELHGIDASESMAAKLRAKPGGDRIRMVIGDFADVEAEGPFSLVFVVFNSFFALLTQEDQIRCFRNVAGRLAPGGAFVMEAFVPDLGRFDRGQRTAVERIDPDTVVLEASQHDPVSQQVESRHIAFRGDDLEVYPLKIRYAWPSELDLMARLAGLRLRDRFAGWRREPFGSSSPLHVSVWEPAEETSG